MQLFLCSAAIATFLNVMFYLAIPDKYRNIGPGSMFYDSNEEIPNDPRRFLMFSTSRQLDLLKNSEHIYGDGTFKRPRYFCQHYIFHGEYMGKVFPCVHVLMSNRTQSDYERVIKKLMDWIVSSKKGSRKSLISM